MYIIKFNVYVYVIIGILNIIKTGKIEVTLRIFIFLRTFCYITHATNWR